MTPASPNLRPADPAAVAEAAAAILRGGLAAFPTETVYGLGADATDDRAVASVFAVKERPRFNPLIVHVADLAAAVPLALFDSTAETLAARFWPGPLSLVLPRRAASPVSLLAGAGLDTLAIRAPSHTTAQALLAAVGRPIAAPSANRSGEVSPTRAGHVADSLGAAVDVVLDDGPCPLGLESTVVDLTRSPPALLRPGAVTRERLEEVVGPLDVPAGPTAAPASPGMLARHYAPRRPLRIDALALRPGEALLSFGRHDIAGAAAERNLSETGDLAEAAANLFAMLRQLDRPERTGIAAMPIPDRGLGAAINDRLRRAAADPPPS